MSSLRRLWRAANAMRPGDDLGELAEDAVAAGAGVLGVAGGDGSMAPVAAVACRHGLPFVCVPAGIRSHFALDLGLDPSDQRLASAPGLGFAGCADRPGG